MRSWKKWFVASLVPLVCFAVLLVTGLTRSGDRKVPPANAKLESRLRARETTHPRNHKRRLQLPARERD